MRRLRRIVRRASHARCATQRPFVEGRQDLVGGGRDVYDGVIVGQGVASFVEGELLSVCFLVSDGNEVSHVNQGGFYHASH